MSGIVIPRKLQKEISKMYKEIAKEIRKIQGVKVGIEELGLVSNCKMTDKETSMYISFKLFNYDSSRDENGDRVWNTLINSELNVDILTLAGREEETLDTIIKIAHDHKINVVMELDRGWLLEYFKKNNFRKKKSIMPNRPSKEVIKRWDV